MPSSPLPSSASTPSRRRPVATLRHTVLPILAFVLALTTFANQLEQAEAYWVYGSDVCLLFDPDYVDVSSTPSSGNDWDQVAYNLQQVLQSSLSRTVRLIQSADDFQEWQSNLTLCRFLVIPRGSSNTGAGLTFGSNIVAAILEWNSNGGHLIKSGYRPELMFKDLMPTDWVSDSGWYGTFEGGKVTLVGGGIPGSAYSFPDPIDGPPNVYWLASNASGAVYTDSLGNVHVAHQSFSQGWRTYLGWDYDNSLPNGTADSGWISILQGVLSIPSTSTSLPAPSSQGGTSSLIFPVPSNPGCVIRALETDGSFDAQNFVTTKPARLVVFDASDNVVATVPFPDVWQASVDMSDPVFDLYSFYVFLGPAKVEIDLRYFKQDTNLTFAGIDLVLLHDLVKWTISVTQNSSNPVGVPDGSFEIQIALNSGQPLRSLEIVPNQPLVGITTYNLKFDGFRGTLEMFDRAVVDGAVRNISHRIDGSTMTLIVKVPFCTDTIVYDPNLSLLVDSITAADEDDSGDGTDATLIIVLTTVLVGIALIAVVVVIVGFVAFGWWSRWRRDDRVEKRMDRVRRAESQLGL